MNGVSRTNMNAGRPARIAFVTLLCLLAALPSRACGASIDDYVQRSGLSEQLALIADKAIVQIEVARGESQEATLRLTGDQMDRLRSAVKDAFAADRLRLAVRTHLEALLPSGDTELFLKWLDTPFGKRVTAIEIAASSDEAPRLAADNASQSLAGLPPARKADLERILTASGVGERTATMAFNIARVMALAAGMQVPNVAPAYGAADMLKNPRQDSLEPSRKRIAAALAPEALAYCAAVYAPLSDDELREYASALERSSSRRVIEATNIAFDRAVSEGAIEAGRRLEAAKPPATRSDRKN